LAELVTLDLPAFAQATPESGGAACAQMMLGSAEPDQATLTRAAHQLGSEEPGWKMPPDALAKLLTERSGRAFACHPDPTADQAMRRIAWSILHDRVAPAVLVWKCRHWALVTGFEADSVPESIDDEAWGLRGFYLRNPYGAIDQHVDAGSWKAQYQTGVGHGVWRAKRIVVCTDAAAAASPKLRHATEPDCVRRELIDDETIAHAAAAAITGDRFARHPAWREAARDTEPGEPMLVTRINLPADHYYIVPMLRAGRPALLVILDAYDGRYRESTRVGADASGSFDTGRAQLDAMLNRGAISIPGNKEPIPVWPTTTTVFPTLTWRPCLESLSPYLPFFHIHTGSRQLHLRLDGQWSGELSIRSSGA